MKRYLTVGIISGVLVIIVVAFSWYRFPAWQDPASGGFWALLGATIAGVVVFVQSLVSIWKDLREEKKEEPKLPTLASLQSIDSQKADSIYNAPGGTINIVPQPKLLESKEDVIQESTPEKRKKNKRRPNTVVDGLNWEFASSSVIFDGRLRDAFPGLRGIERLAGSEAVSRLSILLRNPLFVNLNEIGKGQINPFWWFRGRSNLHINYFEQIDSNRILMDYYEMHIDHIVAVREFSAEERNFVYVHVLPDKPTGLYKYSAGWLDNYLQDQLERNWGYYFKEEYGVWKDKLITREEYDDGASMIDGRPTNTSNANLRVRYITPYNFVICGQDHVLNNGFDVDTQTTILLNEILLGIRTVEDLVHFVETLSRSPRFNL